MAADILTVVKAVPQEKLTKRIAEAYFGAANAGPSAVVYQEAGPLVELVTVFDTVHGLPADGD